MKKALVIGFVLAAGATLLSLYSIAYFGWLTATPLSDAEAKRVKYDFYVWTAVLVISLISLAGLVLLTALRRRRPHR
jgi:heme exporter protein CcmD